MSADEPTVYLVANDFGQAGPDLFRRGTRTVAYDRGRAEDLADQLPYPFARAEECGRGAKEWISANVNGSACRRCFPRLLFVCASQSYCRWGISGGEPYPS